MSIYITGDVHGFTDRLEPGAYPELDALTKEDYLIICGDFGFIWNDGKEELPDQGDYRRARDSLERANWQVDYIITHCAPTSVQDRLGKGGYKADRLTEFLEEVAQRYRFHHWFFGHYHMDGHLGDRFSYLYEELLQLT